MRIGPYDLGRGLVLAPMAGVTDQPFRNLCRALGADMAVSEMVTCDPRLWHTQKSRLRLDHSFEKTPSSVQIVGTEPEKLAAAALANVERGAHMIDINMGCPAKKVCNVAAGSALLRDERKVAEILDAVVSAVDVPVTLKIRTGWDPDHRNGVAIACLAERAGISALAVHGRTRACAFRGHAEYDTIRAIKDSVAIPVLANGDVVSPKDALHVLEYTGADGIMIGRAAQGNPWIFREIRHFLTYGAMLPPAPVEEVRDTLLAHLAHLHGFYGEWSGVRIARKHLAWYCKPLEGGKAYWARVNRVESAEEQTSITRQFLDQLVCEEGLAA
ncbi:MAG: tRNA dihydrouridine synthase DusB [Chromatiales bacterium]|jgi:tRNA-dihydrouridine synthase B|nr:tRNA dihydrouridine synthase DusB [Chromatiales bacterium]